MKAKDEQKSGDEAKYSGYFNRLKHMGKQAFAALFEKGPKESDTFIYVRGDESSHYHDERGSKYDRKSSYPAYGMDIPGACKSFPSSSMTISLPLSLSQVCQVVLVIFYLVDFLR